MLFMLLMPNTNARQAYLYCERVRKTVANTPVFINDMYIDITVSIGVAYFDGTDSLKDALREADRALYKAKKDGRFAIDVDSVRIIGDMCRIQALRRAIERLLWVPFAVNFG